MAPTRCGALTPFAPYVVGARREVHVESREDGRGCSAYDECVDEAVTAGPGDVFCGEAVTLQVIGVIPRTELGELNGWPSDGACHFSVLRQHHLMLGC
jgi:hypothetical protein